MLHDLPTGFFVSLFGSVAAAGLALWLVHFLLRRGTAWARLRRMARDEEGSAVVEFPFALLVLVILVLMMSQLAFMTTAYVMVDYAAFTAVRSAIVVYPEDRGGDEGPNKIGDKRNYLSSTTGGKWFDLRSAAAIVLYPISGDYTNGGDSTVSVNWSALPGPAQQFQQLFNIQIPNLTVPTPPILGDLAQKARPAARMAYAYFNTDVAMTGSNLLTVTVTHWFSLRVPFASRVFKTPKILSFGPIDVEPGFTGPVTSITARASMLNEGASGVKPKVPAGYEEPD